MRLIVRSVVLMISMLCLAHSSAKSDQNFDPLDPGLIQQRANSIEFDRLEPNSPVAGKVTAAGTVTEAKGWTCTKVEVTITNTATNKVESQGAATLQARAWSYSATGLPNKAPVKVVAVGTFKMGNTTDTKDVTGFLTVR